LFYPLGLAVAWACWRNARLAGLDEPSRLAWWLLGASALCLFVSGTAEDMFIRSGEPLGPHPWIGWVEVANLVLAIAGYLAFPNRTLTGRGRARFLLDVGLTVVAGVVVSIYFGLRLWFGQFASEPLSPSILARGIDWILFVVVSVAFLQKRDAATRTALGIYLLAVGANLLGNYVYSTSAIGAGTTPYRPGDAVDGLWFAAWSLRWTAARVAWHRYRAARDVAGRLSDPADVPYESSAYSYVMVAGAFALLVGQVFAGNRPFVGLLAFSAALMVALLVARQLVELRENDRLFAARLAQEARFRSLVQHSSDVVLVVDAGGRLSFASPSASRVFGGESGVRAGASLLDLVSPDDRPALTPLLAGSGVVPRRVQVRMAAGDRSWRDIEAVWTDLRADPAVAGIVINCRDVSERAELERQLRHTQKLDAVGHLAGGLAHDLNNVLAIIRGYTELLRLELPEGTTTHEDLRHIEHTVDRAAAVTTKVLAFSRRQPAQQRVLDLNAVVSGLEPMIRQLTRGRADLRIECDPALWPIKADPGQMEQVLINLASNARDAMPDGGSLRIVTTNRVLEPGEAETAALAPGEYVALVVSDQGVGMSPEVRQRVFEPFFSTKPKEQGVGLGLAMVHGIVLGSGGGISVDSAPGHGATFTILLPRTAAHRDDERTAEPAAPRPTRSHTVLVVDDEADVREVARRILERDGYRVIEAPGGLEALAAVADAAVEVDVLLTDMVMPGLHGRDLIARFQAARPGVPVVCMTGYAGEGDDPGAFAEDLLALVTKPFSGEVLRRTVATAVARRNL
jgi:PAS domain S-box-containing protein